MITAAETYDTDLRRKMLARMGEYLDNGFRDPELLYLGGRYAASLGLDGEARRFLSHLERLLCRDDAVVPAYCAVGLILRALLPLGEERQLVDARLGNLAARSTTVAAALASLNRDPDIARYELLRNATPQEQDAQLSALLGLEASSNNIPDGAEPSQLYRLATAAYTAYYAQQPARARQALECILMQDGDQPAVLRNLITIASEQQDAEAYERYWRRYVQVQLGRIARHEDMDIAWRELTQFYTRVAELMDRELDKSVNEVSTILTRPGFLSRWLEAVSALIWLEAALKARRIWQMGLEQAPGDRRKGCIAVMRFWLATFYPEFGPYLVIGEDTRVLLPLPSREARVQLVFNPRVRLLRRFLEWSRFGFALNQAGKDGDRHTQAVLAMAHLAARTPIRFYAADPELLKAVSHEPGEESRPVRDVIRDACSYPLFALRLANLLKEQDWQGIVDQFGEPDMAEHLTPQIRLFLAFACCQTDQPFDGLRVACSAVAEMSADELKPDTQGSHLWEQVLHACIGVALDAQDLPPGHKPLRRFTPPASASTHDPLAIPWRSALAAAQEGKLLEAREVAWGLPDGAARARNDMLAAIDGIQAERERATAAWVALLRWQLEQLPQHGPPAEARRAALEKVERIVLQVTVNHVIEEAKALVQRDDYAGARAALRSIPEDTPELKELKARLHEQIDEVEQHAKEQAALSKLVDEVIAKAKAAVERGRFADARTSVQQLPNHPEQIQQLKTQLLAQIAEVETQWRAAQREVERLTQRLTAKQVNWEAVRRVARENDIDTSNPIAYVQLLSAIDKQV